MLGQSTPVKVNRVSNLRSRFVILCNVILDRRTYYIALAQENNMCFDFQEKTWPCKLSVSVFPRDPVVKQLGVPFLIQQLANVKQGEIKKMKIQHILGNISFVYYCQNYDQHLQSEWRMRTLLLGKENIIHVIS